MNAVMRRLGKWLARFLGEQNHVHGTSAGMPTEMLRHSLQPADVLLVEGHSRISTAIKFLTQSTWSHAALYVGVQPAGCLSAPDHCFVEADLAEGVRSIGFGEFEGFHTRICRPVGLSEADRQSVCDFAIVRLGHGYDLRNVIDLVRYLLPTPPVPARFRRRMLTLGSGDPTRAICSTLIAEAFQSIHYPVLPELGPLPAPTLDCPGCVDEMLRVRHHSLYVPRDFDASPYFRIIKPVIEQGFDHRALRWRETEGLLGQRTAP